MGIFYYSCNFCHICWKLIRGTYELVGPSNQFSDHTFYVKSKLKLFSSRFLWAKYFVLITFSNFGLWNITQGFFTFEDSWPKIRSYYTLSKKGYKHSNGLYELINKIPKMETESISPYKSSKSGPCLGNLSIEVPVWAWGMFLKCS